MRLANTVAAFTAIVCGAVLIALTTTAANAGTSNATGSACATPSQFAKVANGQTVAQVQSEMGSAGLANGGPNTDAKNGFSHWEPTWTKCPGTGLFQSGIAFRANPGQQLTVDETTTYAL